MKILVVVAFVISFAQPLLAGKLAEPKGQIVLTLSGDMQNETSNGVVQIDRAMLAKLPQTQFSTTTIWLEGDVEFTGVSLKAVLEYAGFTGSKIEAVALNDYKIEIPTSEIDNNAPIIAYLMNGAEMSARGKGPLWIVYPYDEDAKYRTEVIYSRSIWQLDRIILVK